MADCHHTPELASAKVKYPTYRRLTVLETTCEAPSKAHCIGINYVPVDLEPCIVLRGKWLRKTGFTPGQNVLITINPEQLMITPKHDE
ncbi:type I addiction module toxin, SymE family [Thalassomonas viridans]|uniref:Type I addiction module toxin, SymE family n=1 Tax=Thalassomonas viridans TaxID=137584 RepID=A0AAE9YXJ3_9GAMM|nr:SymE family type I addiction module toxin [Thalassomonas viridans]WDE02748.1 type I addiction module toxin, SymE family [Thalassomonas viridans]